MPIGAVPPWAAPVLPLRVRFGAPGGAAGHSTMSDIQASVLLVVSDDALMARLRACLSARPWRLTWAPRSADALIEATAERFDAIVVGVRELSAADVDLVRRLKARATDTELIVTAGTALLGGGFVADSHATGASRAAVRRGVLPRRDCPRDRASKTTARQSPVALGAAGRQRDLAASADRSSSTRSSTGALQRSFRALDAAAAAPFDCAMTSPDASTWLGGRPRSVRGRCGPARVALLRRPSDLVIASRSPSSSRTSRGTAPEAIADTLPSRSCISVPMLMRDELLGTLGIGAATPADSTRRRAAARDHRGQIGVAVQNARLHDSVRRGKREWEQTFDAIGDPIAVFDAAARCCAATRALAAHLGRRSPSCAADVPGVGFCGGDRPATAPSPRALGNDGMPRRGDAARRSIFSVTTFPVARRGRRRVGRAGGEERHGGDPSARRMRQMSEELAAPTRQLDGHLERLKSTQAQLLQAEKLSAIGQLVAGVAHELNNPLTSVIGYAQLLEDECSRRAGRDAAGHRARARTCAGSREESERAARIVRNLLAFARRQTAERAPQDVADCVDPGAVAADVRASADRASSSSPSSSRGCRRSSPMAASCSRRCSI